MENKVLDLLKQAERKVDELTELRKALYNNAKAQICKKSKFQFYYKYS